ncbi:zf-HC2 domain-containing protein [Streptomyces sp. TRM70308]|uniref:zf-HC2 domain-containing protein n=1 Tax=Streptomyces sp. TRM70308 TaxID=3131932 RepID=UPI003CFE6666
MSGAPEPTRAEQHLGDRLAALIDGELGHDARERVLAHLATCHGCKAEADAQRRVKSVFADTAPPPPSAGLLARLQGLPVTAHADSSQASSAREDDDGGPGGGARSPLDFSYLAGAAPPADRLRPADGFPVHRPSAADRGLERAAAVRGRRRFAFAAAGAFSLAAVALGSALGGAAPGQQPTASTGPGTAPPRTTAGVERPADRRNESVAQGFAPARKGTGGRAVSDGPTTAPGAVAVQAAPGAGAPPHRYPAYAHAPGVPFPPVPPAGLRVSATPGPSPAPGATPMAVSRRP